MSIKDVLQILQTYNHVDIESKSKVIRKHIATDELSEELLKSYLAVYGEITLIPKNGSNKIVEQALNLDGSNVEYAPSLGSVNAPYQHRSTSPESELYKIMYENAKEEAREYKRKYEDALNDKHKAEIELAGSKSSGLGEIAQGLAGFAPMLLGAGNQSANALGNAPAAPQQQVQVTQKADVRLQGIVKHYNGLDEETKAKVYTLLTKVFSDTQKLDEVISLID